MTDADLTTQTPARLGWRMPAEWEPHRAVWLAWPHNPVHFDDLDRVHVFFVEMIYWMQTSELVNLLVPTPYRATIAQLLADRGCNAARIRLHELSHRDVWLRDSGPTFLVRYGYGQTPPGSAELAATDWVFDAWGGKYDDVKVDDELAPKICAHEQATVFRAPLEMEGGAIDVDGQGTVLTTDTCLIESRNPQLGRRTTEVYRREHLGARHVIWLPKTCANDDADGHADNNGRFTAPGRIAVPRAHRGHIDHDALETNFEHLKSVCDARGASVTVVELPHPEGVTGRKGELPASYCNFYVGNRVVLVPAFGLPQDEQARQILAREFPGRDAVSLDCRDVLTGGGTIHCLSQQQPGV